MKYPSLSINKENDTFGGNNVIYESFPVDFQMKFTKADPIQETGF